MTHVPPRVTPMMWLRRNLFRSVSDGIVTVLASAVALAVLYKTVRFIFVTGRWDIVRVNLRLLMIGRYPVDEMNRLAIAVIVLSTWAGLVAGIMHARRIHDGRVSAAATQFSRRRVLDLADRFWIPVLVVILLLALTETAGPTMTAVLAAVTALVGRLVGPFIGRRPLAPLANAILAVTLAAVPLAVYGYVVSAVGFDDWGGFMLNLFLALCAIILCYPLGVLLALGRRSTLPLVRAVSTVYIEVVRGAPLFVLLLFANVALGFFVPSSLTPSTPTRAIIVFTLFTAAYMAEIVRGGLQSVPRGQFEAAKALGLSPPRQTGLIILPQALRNVIPAQIGQLISLFKDTALAGIAMGLFDLLQVTSAITQQPAFRGQGLIGETLTIGALLFWAVSYTMSRESQRLERKLGVGTR